MNGKTQLGDFLQARRSQLRPADVGVRTYGERRRVPGLRREELALLAGVSASYYTRLEQGQSLSASAEVLDAIAGALRLNESERQYLHDLAKGDRRRPRARRPAPERLTEATRQLLDMLGDVPAIVLGRRSDVLTWNRLGHALFAGHLAPNAPGLSAEWSAPESLEAAISANCLSAYQIPVLDNRLPRTFSGVYHRNTSGFFPRYTTAPSPSSRASHHRRPPSLS